MDHHSEAAGDVADTKLLRRAFGTFATGVTVVTVGGVVPHGMTANSFASVSLDPPLLLVCVGVDAVMHQRLITEKVFGVSVLGSGQEQLARHFANRWRSLGNAEFESVDWTPGPRTGTPLITGALAHFECALDRIYGGGDHTIFVGRLLTVLEQPERDAVTFFNGKFRQLTAEDS